MRGRIAFALLGLMPAPALAQPSPNPRPPASAFPDSTPLRAWQGHRAGITDVQFSPNGRLVASASLDGTVCVWLVPRFTRTWCAAHGAEVYRLAWSPDGALLATTGGDARVVLWRGSSGERVATSTLPHWAVTLAWRGDSVLIAPTVHGEIVAVSRLGGRTHMLFTLEKEVLTLALSHDARVIATGVPLELHELDSGHRVFRGQAFAQGGIAFSPRGNAIASAEWVAGARLLNPQDGTLLQELRLDSSREMGGLAAGTATVNMPAADIAYSPDGTLLAVAGTDFAVWLWRVGEDGRAIGAPVKRIAHGASVTRVAFSPDGRLLASVGLDRRIAVWQVR